MFLLIKNNTEKLYTAYTKSRKHSYKLKIVNRLIELESSYLWRLIRTDFDEIVSTKLLEISIKNDDVKKIRKIYSDSTVESIHQKIVNYLILNKKNKALHQIRYRKYEDKIFDYLNSIYGDKPQELYKLLNKFSTVEIQKDIIKKLITFEKIDELWELLNSNHNEQVFNGIFKLIVKNKNYNKLMELYKDTDDDDSKGKIIEFLIHSNLIELIEKLPIDNFENKIQSFLINRYKDDPNALYKLFKKSTNKNVKFKVVKILQDMKAEKILIQLIDDGHASELFNDLFTLLSEEKDFEKLLVVFNKIIDPPQKEKILDFFIASKQNKIIEQLKFGKLENKIISYLTEEFPTDEKRLKKYFNECRNRHNKEHIVDTLIALEAIDTLKSIMYSELSTRISLGLFEIYEEKKMFPNMRDLYKNIGSKFIKSKIMDFFRDHNESLEE